jgi:hypothetical protein
MNETPDNNFLTSRWLVGILLIALGTILSISSVTFGFSATLGGGKIYYHALGY